ncbi:hypothetical protein KRR26_10330 [Corallococcus sp. M34]|uniref:hypothetical protein n=1 Tax=Citreicoccus inhibens TaxID=2849499 RepID=UPI001C2287AB|nr:hypothetical protein [Citreicoccus inhibens]MBU8896004.1 hypothetical protein [Citreicoccus inhibens]
MKRPGDASEDARELRDALEVAQAELRRTREHLDKLRAHHARERDALQDALEEARREGRLQRARAEQAEAREAELRRSREATASRSREQGMHVPSHEPERPLRPANTLVALPRPPGVTEEVVRALSEVLKLSAVDIRLRLSQPPPVLLARVNEEAAATLVEALRAASFTPVVCELASRSTLHLPRVRTFALDVERLHLTTEMAVPLEVSLADVRLLVRGQRARVAPAPELIPIFPQSPRWRTAPAAAKHASTEHFLWVFGEGFRASFDEGTELGGMGAARRAPTHVAGLQALMEALRWRAPHAVVDDRLLRMPRLTLPFVDEDQGQEVFADLLFQAVRAGLWP